MRAAEASLAMAEIKGVWQRCRHFTFIYRGNRLLSVGLNSPKTHPNNLMYRYKNREDMDISRMVGTHSEMSAVLKMGEVTPKGLTLVNTRINRKGFLDLSRPCNGCLDMITKMGFREVYHTTREGRFVLFDF